MRTVGFVSLTLFATLLMTASVASWSQTTFTPAELDELLAPIALYPDPLLAQILPAATYPDQLLAASEFTSYQAGSGVDYQPWDVSVKSVAHYPSVLKMMVDSPDWTIAVGQAYVNQPDAVLASIQRLRGRARLMGYLNSNAQQTVAVSNGYISIVPAQAGYIYVPTYNPQVVYTTRRPSYGSSAIYFGIGLLIGAWLNNAIDWNHHSVYYHGWSGGGWIARSRPRVQVDNRYYNRPFTVNRGIRSQDISGYRQDLRRNTGTYRTPGLARPSFTVPSTRPGVPSTRPTPRPGVTPKPAPRPGAITPRPSGVTPRPAPRPGAITPRPSGGGPRVPAVRPTPKPVPSPRPARRPITGVSPSVPRVMPSVPIARPAPKPGAGVTRPNPRVAPPTAQPAPRPGVTRPKPDSRLSAPSAQPAPRVTRPTSTRTPQATHPAPKAGAKKNTEKTRTRK